MENKDKFVAKAKEGIVTVEFTKIDTGELRVMPCTLNSELANTELNIENYDTTSDNFVVWSLDKDAWRSFRANTVIRWYEGNPIEQESKESSD